MELREFRSFFFGIIETSENIASKLAEDSGNRFRTAAAQYHAKSGTMSSGRQLFNEVALTRSIESFDLYLLQTLRLIFAARPDLVIEEERLNDEASKSDFSDSNEYFLHLAERKLMKLSYKPLSALRQYVLASTGIELFESEDLFETINLATELRNLIAHNDCRVNKIFQKRIKTIPIAPDVEPGYRFAINDELLDKCIGAMDHVIFSFDALASAGCNLPTMNRFSSFFFRDDFAPTTIQ